MLEDSHHDPKEPFRIVLNILDILFTCIFLVEMLLKWIGFGLKKYFSDAWCWLDFLILHVRLPNGFIAHLSRIFNFVYIFYHYQGLC